MTAMGISAALGVAVGFALGVVAMALHEIAPGLVGADCSYWAGRGAVRDALVEARAALAPTPRETGETR